MTSVGIIGAGHNGLITAVYLARAGFEVTVFEARSKPGGCCDTSTLFGDQEISTLAAWMGLLHPRIIEDLNLTAHGLRLMSQSSGQLTVAGQTVLRDDTKPKGIGADDWVDYQALWSRFEHVAEVYARDLLTDDGSASAFVDRLAQAEVEKPFAASLLTLSLEQLVRRHVRHPDLVAAFLAEAADDPAAPGSAMGVVHAMSGTAMGQLGEWGFVEGGMGALADALTRSAVCSGVDVRTSHAVHAIVTSRCRSTGLKLENGTTAFDLIVSNVDPWTTRMWLLPGHLANAWEDTGRQALSTAKVHLLTARDPRTAGEVASTFCVAPSGDVFMDDLRRARRGLLLEHPTITAHVERGLSGKWTVQAHHHFVPATLSGREWSTPDDEALVEKTVEVLERVMPGLVGAVVEQHVINPSHLETEVGLGSRSFLHRPMTADGLFERRTYGGDSPHATSLEGLWLCGAGTRPGGFVSGVPGYQCAQEILRALGV